MKHKYQWSWLQAVCVMFATTPVMAQGVEITRGALLANTCAACHGTDGKSPGSIPVIAGKPADYIIKTFKEFSTGERPSTVMGRHAKGYTEEELKQIAEYFAKQ